MSAEAVFAIAERICKRATETVERVLIGELFSDPSYQRPPDRERIKEMAESGRKLQPIRVNLRPDGTLWVLDGQHRAGAALLRGQSTIAAVILTVPQEEEAEHAGLLRAQARESRGVVVKVARELPSSEPPVPDTPRIPAPTVRQTEDAAPLDLKLTGTVLVKTTDFPHVLPARALRATDREVIIPGPLGRRLPYVARKRLPDGSWSFVGPREDFTASSIPIEPPALGL